MAIREEQEGVTGERLGARIDALDAALREFEPKRLDSLLALERQLRFVADEARLEGMEEIAAAADQAFVAGALEARRLTEALLGLMRDAASKCRKKAKPNGGRIDAETGLPDREAFAGMLEQYAGEFNAEAAAVIALRVEDYGRILADHGAQVARGVVAHVATVLARHVRSGDVVARVDADAFAVLLPREDGRGMARAFSRLEGAVADAPFRLPEGGSLTLAVRTSGHALNEGESSPAGPAAGRLAVGIVSRSAATAKVLEARLRSDGYDVIQTSLDDEQALRHLAGGRVHAVFLDEPNQDLAAAMKRLRAALANRRAPVVTLVRDEAEGRRALTMGASDFLSRPVDLNLASAALRRLASRGCAASKAAAGRESGALLVVSRDMYHLIGIGSALHKQGCCEIHLGRGCRDALVQIKRCAPGVVIMDLRLHEREVHDLLRQIAGLQPEPCVILIIEEHEKVHASVIKSPRISNVITKPVNLLAIAEEVKKAAGLETRADGSPASKGFQSEILRVVQMTAGDGI